MAVTLNTSDPLFSQITALICVDPATNTIKEIVANRAISTSGTVLLPNSGTPSSTAPFGSSFRTVPAGDFSPAIAELTTGLTVANGDDASVFVVVNKRTSSGGQGQLGGVLQWPNSGVMYGFLNATGPSTAVVNNNAHSFAITRNGSGTGLAKIYIDGTVDPAYSSGASIGNGSYAWGKFGGEPGYGAVDADFVYCVLFQNYILTDADVTRLNASLTGGGNFALVSVSGGGGGDTTVPTLTGSISVTNLTSTSYTLTWPAGADNVAVTGYEYSLNGGTSYTALGNVLTVNITGRTAGATDQVRVRAFDAAGNKSTPALSSAVTLQAAAVSATVTTPPLKNNTATVQASVTGLTVHAIRASTGAFVVTKTAQATNASGVLAVSDAALTAGVGYHLAIVNPATGAVGITNSITAV